MKKDFLFKRKKYFVEEKQREQLIITIWTEEAKKKKTPAVWIAYVMGGDRRWFKDEHVEIRVLGYGAVIKTAIRDLILYGLHYWNSTLFYLQDLPIENLIY